MTQPPLRLPPLAILLAISATAALSQTFPAPPEQVAQYEAPIKKTILELQPFRREWTVTLASGNPEKLISLNPNVNATFLLEVGGRTLHIENADPQGQKIELGDSPTPSLRITVDDSGYQCDLWQDGKSLLQAAVESGLPYAPLCGGRLYLRNNVEGSRSSLELVTDFLRDRVWKGDEIVGFVKDRFYKDRYAESSELLKAEQAGCADLGPCPAAIEPRYSESAIAPIGLGVALADPEQDNLITGAWYPAAGLAGVYVSAIQPRTISADILNGPGRVSALDSIESKAVDYLIAFDMDRYALGFGLGTDHPRVDWSPRPAASARIPGLPGPDGIGDVRPLIRSGMVDPKHSASVVATFTGGFKRSHGAFKFGDYAFEDTGKHYGFIEKGVIYSKLKTELATIYVLTDGTIDMKTWTEEDNALLPQIVYARQNGVPLVRTDPESGQHVPGALVNSWGPGNWSGSAETELRTLRAGACMQDYQGHKFLIYAYFSTATPSAMARTFQAYSCRYAMLMDMNALEHTYLSVFPRTNSGLQVEHLVTGMAQLDKQSSEGGVIPRFLGYPDNRDFFFVYSKEPLK